MQRAMRRMISDFTNLTSRETERNGLCKEVRDHGFDDVVKLEEKHSAYFSELLE